MDDRSPLGPEAPVPFKGADWKECGLAIVRGEVSRASEGGWDSARVLLGETPLRSPGELVALMAAESEAPKSYRLPKAWPPVGDPRRSVGIPFSLSGLATSPR